MSEPQGDPVQNEQLDLQAESAEPPPPPPAPVVDVDAIAQLVTEKLLANVAQTPAPSQGNAPNTYEQLLQYASDPTHPLYAIAQNQLAQMRAQGEEAEWQALGADYSHPARALYRSNPGAFGGRPVFAFQAWENGELKKKQAEPKAGDPPPAEPKPANTVRATAPGMPSRSVGAPARQGKRTMTLEEFEAAVANDPSLDDAYDKGNIIIKQ
jgi:hypothetical protein